MSLFGLRPGRTYPDSDFPSHVVTFSHGFGSGLCAFQPTVESLRVSRPLLPVGIDNDCSSSGLRFASDLRLFPRMIAPSIASFEVALSRIMKRLTAQGNFRSTSTALRTVVLSVALLTPFAQSRYFGTMAYATSRSIATLFRSVQHRDYFGACASFHPALSAPVRTLRRFGTSRTALRPHVSFPIGMRLVS